MSAKVNRFVKSVLVCLVFCLLYSAQALSVKIDQEAVRQQLGYLPSNFISVSAWKSNGCDPVAIKTYPLNGGARRRQARVDVSFGAPFPTLFWLTCPEISRAVAEFERKGFIRIFEDKLNLDPELASRLLVCHKEYAQERWDSLTFEDQSLLMADERQGMRNMMEFSGISGTNFTAQVREDDKPFVASIKCLHAHYAHFRSKMFTDATQNPVGEMIHAHLLEEISALDLCLAKEKERKQE